MPQSSIFYTQRYSPFIPEKAAKLTYLFLGGLLSEDKG